MVAPLIGSSKRRIVLHTYIIHARICSHVVAAILGISPSVNCWSHAALASHSVSWSWLFLATTRSTHRTQAVMKFRSWPQVVLLGACGVLAYEQKISEKDGNHQVCSGMYGGDVPHINSQSRS